MAFTPTDWKDGADGGTPITAAELNRMEQGIADGQNTAATAAGTAAQLTAGTDTVQRTWSAKMIAGEIARQIAAIPTE